MPAVDDTLQLYFLCAHPSLTPSSAVALTLRAVGGLTTRQIAQAYLVPEATMAQRISRAKRTVSGVRFDRPGDVATVLRVLYLVFNEGYSGDVDLAAEAIRLTRRLAAVIDHPEVAGLLALMLLHHARRAARTAPDGSLVRSPSRTAAGGTPSRSPRASRSCRRPSPATGWASSRPRPPSRHSTPTRPPPRRPTGCRSSRPTSSRDLTDSPVVRLNRAVAVGEADGPRAGLAALAALDGSSPSSRLHPDRESPVPRHTAVAAYLHERDGDLATAARLYAEAARKAPNLAERDHLTRQAARLNARRRR